MKTKDITCIVHGTVQGVNFRHFAKRKAEEFGLTGFAENVPDGTVKIVAQGPEETLRKFIEQLSVGPSTAEVESIDVIWLGTGEEYSGFEIR